MRRSVVALVALVATANIAAACGGDDSEGADSTAAAETTTADGTATTAASSATTTAEGGTATTAAPSEPTGEPVEVVITVGLTGSSTFPQVQTAMLAAEAAINAEGGIKGRPLKVDFCDGKSTTDPTEAIKCNRDAADNQNVVASVGDYTAFGDQVIPIQHDAGMATVAPIALSGAAFSLDTSFPLTTSESLALGVLVADQGAERVGVAYVDFAGGSQSVDFGNIALGMKHGTKYVQTAPIPLTATDVTPQVASFDESDGVALSIALTQVAQFVKAYAQGGYDYILGAPAQGLLPKDIETLGDTADGVYVVSGLPIMTGDNPGIARFKEEMATQDPDASLDEIGLNAWIGLHAFAQVANGIDGDVTRESVLAAWKGVTSLDVYGLLPPELNLQVSPLGVPGLERLTNVWAQYGQIENGEIKDLGTGWVSIITPS